MGMRSFWVNRSLWRRPHRASPDGARISFAMLRNFQTGCCAPRGTRVRTAPKTMAACAEPMLCQTMAAGLGAWPRIPSRASKPPMASQFQAQSSSRTHLALCSRMVIASPGSCNPPCPSRKWDLVSPFSRSQCGCSPMATAMSSSKTKSLPLRSAIGKCAAWREVQPHGSRNTQVSRSPAFCAQFLDGLCVSPM